jgi:4-amino-4-deoxy-L-arabinose transferase-like glycosyltransferase
MRAFPKAAGVSIFLVALLASLLFVHAYPLPEVRYDSMEYLSLARNLAAGKGFTQDGVTPAVYRPPLFSALLGGWFFLTGTSSPLSAAVLQSFFHAAGTAFAFLLFLEITPSLAWATCAALFLAVNPLLVTRVAFVMQEPTLLLFTTLAAWLSIRLIKAPSMPRAALTGAAWGLCTLAKAVAWFAPFLFLAMRFLPGRLRWEWKRWEAAALLLCFAAAIAPWTLRNYVHFHRLIPVNAQGEGLLEWIVAYADPPGQIPGSALVEELDRRGVAGEKRMGALRDYLHRNFRYVLFDRTLKNAIDFAGPARDWWWERGRYGPGEPRPWYWTAHDLLLRFLFFSLLFRAVQTAAGRRGPVAVFAVLFCLGYWLEYAMTFGMGRYALPIYPLLAAMPLPWRVRRC